MNEAELRQLVRGSLERPFAVCMDDGVTYRVSHPDFAFVAPQMLIIVSGPTHDLGKAGLVFCPYNHISRVEVLQLQGGQS